MSKSPTVLAFSDTWHDSSFCIFSEDDIVHIESERFTRQKYERLNPLLLFCEIYNSRVEDFFNIAVEESTVALAPFLRELVAMKCEHGGAAYKHLRRLPPYDCSTAECPADAVVRNDTKAVEAFLRHLSREDVNIFFCGHHASHAANAFYSSEYSSALTITLDGIGRDYKLDVYQGTSTRAGVQVPVHQIHGSVFKCDGTRCRPMFQESRYSFGFAWARVTELILGLGEGQEGTVMAMAALGDPQRYQRLFDEEWVWLPTPDGKLPDEQLKGLKSFISNMRASLHDEQDRFDVAASFQAATEHRVQTFLKGFIEPSERYLCLAGGVMLNCQLVGKVHNWFPELRGIFVPPAPYDGGITIGAAQIVFHEELNQPRRRWSEAPYAMGSIFSRSQIISSCRSAAVRIDDTTVKQVLELLATGQIVGLFSGPSESGRRALGNRSIIADPRQEPIKERLNSKVKHREWFRPFAPMVLAEEVAEWFECPHGFKSPYMSFAIPVREGVRAKIPAVVHFDGTARVQTVHRNLSPKLHAMLREWKEMTGVSVLLNTSFNDREPIVETPADALNTMARAGLDALFFADENLLVRPSSCRG